MYLLTIQAGEAVDVPAAKLAFIREVCAPPALVSMDISAMLLDFSNIDAA
ncbi:hypothetical protein [Sinorhizobium sp. CCBAU 05631]|nr:hypothetical protein [Sinorhizobium sp. CCBAU 05631]ASY60010.1 hypothetical protein SS05631_b59180 [Sinorhizobium sp. CCBAU 05631]